MQETVIDLIRHGEPVGGRRYRGQGSDDVLSEQGWTQMWSALGNTAPWSQIISSPLQRCLAFALALATRHGLPLAVEPRLREVGLGPWEGQTPNQIEKQDPQAYTAFHRNPARNRPRGAEPLEALIDRVGAAFDEAVASFPARRLLIVTHAGVIRAVIGHLLQAETAAWYRARVDYASLTRVRVDHHGAHLELHNCPRITRGG